MVFMRRRVCSIVKVLKFLENQIELKLINRIDLVINENGNEMCNVKGYLNMWQTTVMRM